MANKLHYKKIITSKEIDKEFNNIVDEVKKVKTPEGFLQFILYVVAELFTNIKEHAMAKKIIIELKIERNNFSLKLNDDGIGLRNSYISKGIIPKDDSSAIEFALAGLSTKSPKERGYGFYTIRQLVEHLNGRMEIKTGEKTAIIEKGSIRFKEILKKEKGVFVLIKTEIQDIDIYEIIK